MVSRYIVPNQEEVEEEFSPTWRWWKFTASFNVAAFAQVPAIRRHDGETEGVSLRWGLIPAWAKGEPQKVSALRAKPDGIERSKTFSSAWLQGQRCILPFAGFYMWQLTPQGHRQPYYVRMVARPVFAVAGVWDRSVIDGDDVIESCALMSVAANPLLAELNASRPWMPAILERENYHAWLNATPVQAKALLKTFPQERMVAHPVSPRVNSLEYNDPSLAKRAS